MKTRDEWADFVGGVFMRVAKGNANKIGAKTDDIVDALEFQNEDDAREMLVAFDAVDKCECLQPLCKQRAQYAVNAAMTLWASRLPEGSSARNNRTVH